MATYDSINAGSFMGTFFKAMSLRMEHDKYVEERRLKDGLNDMNTIGEFRKLRILNEDMSDADFLGDFPGAYSAALKAMERQGIGKMMAGMGQMDEDIGVMPVLDPNTGKYILMGKNKDGETVPVTERRSADPDDMVKQFTMLELIDKAYFLAATKHGQGGFTLDRLMATGAVDDSATSAGGGAANSEVGNRQRVRGDIEGMPPTVFGASPSGGIGSIYSEAPDPAPGSGSIGSRTTGIGVQNLPYQIGSDTGDLQRGPYIPGSETGEVQNLPYQIGANSGEMQPRGPSSSTDTGTGTRIGDGSRVTANATEPVAATAAQRAVNAGVNADSVTQSAVASQTAPNVMDSGVEPVTTSGPSDSPSQPIEAQTPVSSIEQRQVSRRGRITSERREQLARQKEIENLEKELSRLQSPARTRGGGVSAERRQARAAEIQQKRQARAAEIQQRLNELRNPEAVTPAASDTASTAPVKAPPSMEGSTQEDVVAAAGTSAVDVAVDTDDTATATKSAESSLAVEAGKQAQTGGNSIGGAIQNISLQNSQNINYGMLSRQGLFASPNKLSPRQRSVIAASLFRGQWLRGELTPDIVSNMRNFVQTGMFLDEAKAQFTANKQAFDSLETVRKNSAAIANYESQIDKRNFDMQLDTAKLIDKQEDQVLAGEKLGLDIAKEQADLEKETLAAVKTFQESIAKMANDYGIREVGDENKQALAKTTTAIKNITENNLPAMTIASMVLDGQTMEEIAQLFAGKTPAQIKMLSAEALAKQYDRGHFNMFMDLISKYVAYNNKSRGQGWWDSAVNPRMTLGEFAAGMENTTALQDWFGDDPSQLQNWMDNWEMTEEKLKQVAVALSAGQQVMQG